MKLVNISNQGRKLFLFLRNKGNELQIETVNSFFPYFYVPSPEGNYKGYKGESLKKIIVSKPKEVAKNRSVDSYESDILFCRRYLIDKVNTLEKCPIKSAFIDIEVLTDELPDVSKALQTISCISVYNSLNKSIQTFYLGDYPDEYQMIDRFIEYMKIEQFDLWLSWNVKFDFNYLVNRFPDFAERISPIGQTRYGDGEVYYPAGISIVDYLIWFKKITLGKAKAYSLDYIAQKYLKESPNEKIEFGKLSPKIKEKNQNDVMRMVKLEEKFKLISYFDEIRRLSKVEWEDMNFNSRILDMLLLQEAKNQKVVLPMKPAEERGTLSEKEEYAGAYRDIFETGAIFGCEAYDLSSAYPSMIIDFCLDPANICGEDFPDQVIKENLRIEEVRFKQKPNALLPTVVKKLITLKIDIKKKLSTLKLDSSEYKDMKIKYDAIKSITNSAYGVFGNRFFRLYNKNVASATTYLVRDLLHYIEDKIKELGYKILYVDTDGLIIKGNNKDISDLLNKFVKQWANEKYGKEDITTSFTYEGCYEKLLLLAKCRYFGYLKTDKGIEEKVIGIEARRKDSTVWMKKFQRTLIDKILDKEPKIDILNWIKLQISSIKDAPIEEIAFPCRLGRKPEEYKNTPIFLKALRNTEGFEKKVGDPFYYIYVTPSLEEQEIKTIIKIKGTGNITLQEITLNKNLSRKEGIEYIRKEYNKPGLETSRISVLHKKEKPCDVLAFDEENNKHIDRDKIDWTRIIERNILNKIGVIFEAMKWDISEVINV